MKQPLLRAGACILLCAASAQAQASDPGVQLNGSWRAALWSGTRMLDQDGPVPTGAVWLHAVAPVSGENSIVADAFAQADGEGGRTTKLRELFWKARFGQLDLRVGRQLIVWGRADALNPTDSIGGRDYTRLVSDDTDQRDGADAVLATYAIGTQYRAHMVLLPRALSDVIPLGRQPMQSVSIEAPEHRLQYALKLDHDGGSVDWSLSYFNGIDRMPDLSLVGVSAAGVATHLSNHRVQVLGGDFSTTIGGQVVRGEMAWSQRARDDSPNGFFRKRSQLLLLLGGDRNVGEAANVNLQLFVQRVPDYRAPSELGDPLRTAVATLQGAINNQSVRQQYGVTYRLAQSWSNESWQGELSGMVSLTTHATYARAQLRHAIDDRWRLNMGVERYRGEADTLFGQLRRNSTAYVELRNVF